MTGAMAAALLCLPSVLAVSDLHLHKYQAAAFQSMGKTQKGRTLEDDETGKPTVVNGEHLDPYNVPEQLIGDVGLAGPKGEPGKKGVCGEPGPMGKNVSVAKPAAEDLVLHICSDPLHAFRTLHPQCALLVDLALPAEEEDIADGTVKATEICWRGGRG